MLATKQLGTLLSGIAADAAEADRTFTVAVDGAEVLTVVSAVTRVAGSASLIAWYASNDGGTTYGRMQSQAITAGSAVQSDFQHSDAIAASETIADSVPCKGYTHVRGIWSCTGGGAGDLITATGALAIETR